MISDNYGKGHNKQVKDLLLYSLFLCLGIEVVIAIAVCAIVLSRIFGLQGVWMSFLSSEVITFFVIFLLSGRIRGRKNAADS